MAGTIWQAAAEEFAEMLFRYTFSLFWLTSVKTPEGLTTLCGGKGEGLWLSQIFI